MKRKWLLFIWVVLACWEQHIVVLSLILLLLTCCFCDICHLQPCTLSSFLVLSWCVVQHQGLSSLACRRYLPIYMRMHHQQHIMLQGINTCWQSLIMFYEIILHYFAFISSSMFIIFIKYCSF